MGIINQKIINGRLRLQQWRKEKGTFQEVDLGRERC